MSTTVTRKGQVTIPKRVRDYLGLGPGSKVVFEVAPDGRIVLAKEGETRPESRLARWRGALKGTMTTDELMALTRGDDPA
jgi:AbrB family looped-hinge helix DNA binding protein